MPIQLCDNYQEKAHSTSKNTVIFGSKLLYPFFGLCGESGELLEKTLEYTAYLEKKLSYAAYATYTTCIDSFEKFQSESKKEAGDVMWYISEICTQIGIKIQDLPAFAISDNNTINLVANMTICSTKLMEKMKKMFRDGDVTSDVAITNDPVKIETIRNLLGEILCILDVFCESRLNTNLAEITQMNIDKLFSRKERGVISGSGDNR